MRVANLAGLGENLAVSGAPVASDFTGTLAACDFTGTNLTDADMKRADIHKSVFLRCNLQRAQMQGCNVGSVDLASCNLVDTNLTGGIVDDATKFPEGYAVPIGAKNSDEVKRQQPNEFGSMLATFIGVLFVVMYLVFVLSNTKFE